MIIGAGGTRGGLSNTFSPPPLDGDFFDIAGQISGRGTRRLAARVRRDVFDLYRQVSGIGLEQYFRDIETRAHIGRIAKSANKPKDWQRRQDDLEELIRRVLIQTTCDLTSGAAKALQSKAHLSLINYLRRGDTIITFNYDTLIEETLARSKLNWRPGDGYGTTASGITKGWAKDVTLKNGSSKSDVQLLKLHGSLNWTLYKTKQIRLKPRPYVVRAQRGHAVFDSCAMLPPGWQKRIDVNPYRKLWRRARLRLEECTSLVIVGYSLPETDLLAKALFTEVCRLRAIRKRFLKHLYIADPNDAVRQRLQSIFMPALGSTGRVYRYSDIGNLAAAWGAENPRR